MRVKTEILVKKTKLGQYDKIEDWTGYVPVFLDGKNVMLGDDGNSISFSRDDLMDAVDLILDQRERRGE